MAVDKGFLRANMGRLVQVKFKPHWPVPVGNYALDGFSPNGIWVTHEDGHQRFILNYDIEEVILRGEAEDAAG